jgi:thiol-disulfide isomerase/thioredoxin
MKAKIKHYIKEIILFIIFITILTNVVSLYKSQELNKKPLSLVNTTLLNGEEFQYPHNKPILIHFWATWCPVCKVEASNIQTLSKYYTVLTFAVKSDIDEIKHYMSENNLNFNVVNDKNGFIANEFKIAVYPTTFIYNKEKKLIFSEVGYTSTFGMWVRLLWAEF